MALLHDSVDFKVLDTRLVERNVARGVISAEDVKKAVSQLPDDSENAEWVSIDSLAHDLDDSETNGSGLHQQH